MKPILVTMGEPAGIGPDICCDLDALTNVPVVVIGDAPLIQARAQCLGKRIDRLNILHYPGLGAVQPGVLNPAHAEYVLEMLKEACRLCQQGTYGALVTAPVHKAVINQAGFEFTGHTEFLAHEFGCAKVVMMLATPALRVALLTTHVPLRQVPSLITQHNITEVVHILHHALSHQFGVTQPKIGVAGLNPHAGEAGYLGCEEVDIMAPALKQLQKEGIDVSMPLPADTLFTPKVLSEFDAVLCMYHDQGLPVLKAAGFGEAVNITLGLPIIRTSVDHGTALALAGTGQAESSSLIAAVQQAAMMASAQIQVNL